MSAPVPPADRPDPEGVAERSKKRPEGLSAPTLELHRAPALRKRAPILLLAIAALLVAGIFLILRFESRVDVRELAVSEAADAATPSANSPPAPVLAASEMAARSTPESHATEPATEIQGPPANARAMRVTVTDQDFRALPGARVEYFARAGPKTFATDAGGECRVDVETDDQVVQLRVRAEGHLHAISWGYRPQQAVKLRRAIAVFGRVLDARTRVAIPSAAVSWIPDCCRSCKPLVVTADADGRYRIEGVGADAVTLRVEANGYPIFERRHALKASGESAECDLALSRGIDVRGHVVDFTTGAALPGATVSQGATKLIADETGAFAGQLQALGSDPVQLLVEYEGRCQLLARLGASEFARGESLEFRLPDSPIVEGVVRDPAGQPVAGALFGVRLDYMAEVRSNGGSTPPPASALSVLPESWTLRDSDASRGRTDERGAFRAVGLVPWASFHNLLASKAGFDSSQSRLDRLPGPGERLVRDVDLQLAPTDAAGYVHGRVYLNGVPAPVNVRWSVGDRSGEALATSSGYASEKLPSGTVELRALVEGCAGALEGDTATVEVAPGASVAHDFDVTVASATIRGHVQFDRGGPAAHASVTLSVPHRSAGNVYWMPTRREARTADDGSFSIDVPACDLEFRVVAKLDAGTATREGVHPGDDDVRLSIAGSGKLRYRLLDARTSERLDPRALSVVALTPEGALLDELSVDAPAADVEGWSTRVLPEGPIEVMVTGGKLGYRSQRAAVVIVANTETNLELQLEPALHVHFRFEPALDERWRERSVFVVEPTSWTDVRLSKDGGGNRLEGGRTFPYLSLYERKLVFDSEGSAELRCLGPGKYRFKVLPDDVTLEPDSIELEADTSEPIVVHWRR